MKLLCLSVPPPLYLSVPLSLLLSVSWNPDYAQIVKYLGYTSRLTNHKEGMQVSICI